jgi:hypothetical protein
MLADDNFNRPNSIDILLGTDVFFEVLRHDKKTTRKLSSFTGYRVRMDSLSLKKFQGKVSSSATMTT